MRLKGLVKKKKKKKTCTDHSTVSERYVGGKRYATNASSFEGL